VPPNIEYISVNGEVAGHHTDELAELFTEVYGEPPYEWGHDHTKLFVQRFHSQRQHKGFKLIEARDRDQLVGIGFGVTLLPDTPWWQHLITPIDEAITQEYPDRTFALVELLVRSPRRRQHIAETIHDLLLENRIEDRATLTVLPAAAAARAAYRKWGWQAVAQKHNPLPGSPIFDVMVKELRSPSRCR
jgi:hypothetical protein